MKTKAIKEERIGDAPVKRGRGRPRGSKVQAPKDPKPVVPIPKDRSAAAKARERLKKKALREEQSTLGRTKKRDSIRVDARLEETGEKTVPNENKEKGRVGRIAGSDDVIPVDKGAPPQAEGDGPTRVPMKERLAKGRLSDEEVGGYAVYNDCEKCGRSLTTGHFSMIKKAVKGAPSVVDVVCKACRADEQAADLREKNRDRAALRMAKEINRKIIADKAKKKAQELRESELTRVQTHKDTRASQNAAESAARELARRELARRRLLYFTRRFEGQKVDEATGELVDVERAKGKGYIADWVHVDICARLERFLDDVRAGRQPRLMLFMPPRHGKSTIASRMFPAWSLGHDPTLEIIAASYGSSLPEQFSRNVRGILRDPEYRVIFPGTRLDSTRENVQGWATTSNGMYIPVGVGSGITGKGADLLIIDDPFKGAEDAENANQREKVVDWYFSEAYTRLSPNAGVLIILTRWHDADLAGTLLSAQKEQTDESEEIRDSELEEMRASDLTKGQQIKAQNMIYADHRERMEDVEKWEVVSFAAIADKDEYRKPNGKIVNYSGEGTTLLRKKGEALHPSRYPLSRLNKIKRNLFSRMRQRFWHALYQQKPVPDEGIHFSKDMFRMVQLPSDQVRLGWLRLTTWDLAAGQKRQHDWTVGAHGQMDYEGVIHVVQLTRGRFQGAHGVATEVLNDYARNKPQMIGVEKGPLEQFLMPGVYKELEDRNKERGYKDRLTPVFADKEFSLAPIQDPVLRAGPLQSLLQANKMVFSRDLEYTEEMIHEMIRFPGGVHDDIVTALSWLARLMLMFTVPRAPTMKQRQRSWKDKLASHVRGASGGHMAA